MIWLLLAVAAIYIYMKYGSLPSITMPNTPPQAVLPILSKLNITPVFVGSPTGSASPGSVATSQTVAQPEAANRQNLIAYSPTIEDHDFVQQIGMLTPYQASHPPLRDHVPAFGPNVNQPNSREEW